MLAQRSRRAGEPGLEVQHEVDDERGAALRSTSRSRIEQVRIEPRSASGIASQDRYQSASADEGVERSPRGPRKIELDALIERRAGVAELGERRRRAKVMRAKVARDALDGLDARAVIAKRDEVAAGVERLDDGALPPRENERLAREEIGDHGALEAEHLAHGSVG